MVIEIKKNPAVCVVFNYAIPISVHSCLPAELKFNSFIFWMCNGTKW